MDKVKYGIVSTATIVPRFVEGINESGTGEVVAIAGRNLEKARQYAEKLHIKSYYENYQAIYQDSAVDIVYIANFNGGHYQCVKDALNAHKHVLCEKPLALTYGEVNELFQLAQANKVFLMEAQKAVFLPIMKKVKAIIQAKKLGRIQWVNVISSHTGAKRGEWFNQLSNGGGILHGAGTYPLEVLQYLFDSELNSASGLIHRELPLSDERAVVVLRVGEILASVLWEIKVPLKSRIEIYGENGKIIIPNYWKTNQFELTLDGRTEIIQVEMNSEFVYEVQHVNHLIQTNQLTSPIMKPEITKNAIGIIESVYNQNRAYYELLEGKNE